VYDEFVEILLWYVVDLFELDEYYCADVFVCWLGSWDIMVYVLLFVVGLLLVELFDCVFLCK